MTKALTKPDVWARLVDKAQIRSGIVPAESETTTTTTTNKATTSAHKKKAKVSQLSVCTTHPAATTGNGPRRSEADKTVAQYEPTICAPCGLDLGEAKVCLFCDRLVTP